MDAGAAPVPLFRAVPGGGTRSKPAHAHRPALPPHVAPRHRHRPPPREPECADALALAVRTDAEDANDADDADVFSDDADADDAAATAAAADAQDQASVSASVAAAAAATAAALAYMDDLADASDSGSDTLGPSEEERRAVHVCASELLKARQKMQETLKLTSPMKATAKTLRAQLLDWMTTHGMTAVAIPKAVLDASNAGLVAADLPELPPYVRLFENNKDDTILASTVRTALAAVTLADVQSVLNDAALRGKPSTVTAAFFAAVTGHVRTAVRQYTQQVKLMAAPPLGTRADAVEDAPACVADWAMRLHTNEHGAKLLEHKRKAAEAAREARLAQLQPLVLAYFDHANLVKTTGGASERVVLGHTPYRIVRRVSSTKPVIRFATIETVLWGALEDAWHLNRDGGGAEGGRPGGVTAPAHEAAGEVEAAEALAGAGAGGAKGKRRRAGATAPALAPPPPDPIATLARLQDLLDDARTRAALSDSVVRALAALPRVSRVHVKLHDVAKPRPPRPRADGVEGVAPTDTSAPPAPPRGRSHRGGVDRRGAAVAAPNGDDDAVGVGEGDDDDPPADEDDGVYDSGGSVTS